MTEPPENPFQSPQTVDQPPVPDEPLPEDRHVILPGSVVLAWWGSLAFSVLVLAAWGLLGAWVVVLSVLGLVIGFVMVVRRSWARWIGLTFYSGQMLLLGSAGLVGAVQEMRMAWFVLLPLEASAAILLLLMTGPSVGYYKRRNR